ncbi:MAG: class I SAM-dependent methyltransferase [Myxococcota bacterium]
MASRRTSEPAPRATSRSTNLLSHHDDAKWLRFGSLSHYAEPAYYDKCYAARRDDVAFYTTLAAARRPDGVLEYGCGNGRITLALAREGHRVVGVDLSRPMLSAFEQHLADQPPDVRKRVSLRHGDMRDVRLRRRFGLVLCTFNTFLHLYERADVERFLTRVRGHLRPGGRFAFDTSLPLPEELARNPARPYRVPRLKYPPTGQIVKYAEYFDYDPMCQVLRVTMRFEPLDAPDEAWTVLLTHRQYHPCEIEALLHYNGFELESVHPDFVRQGSCEVAADSIAWVAKLRND